MLKMKVNGTSCLLTEPTMEKLFRGCVEHYSGTISSPVTSDTSMPQDFHMHATDVISSTPTELACFVAKRARPRPCGLSALSIVVSRHLMHFGLSSRLARPL